MTINYLMLQRRQLCLFDKKLQNLGVLTSNLVLRPAKMIQGNSKQNCSWQYRNMSKFKYIHDSELTDLHKLWSF